MMVKIVMPLLNGRELYYIKSIRIVDIYTALLYLLRTIQKTLLGVEVFEVGGGVDFAKY